MICYVGNILIAYVVLSIPTGVCLDSRLRPAVELCHKSCHLHLIHGAVSWQLQEACK